MVHGIFFSTAVKQIKIGRTAEAHKSRSFCFKKGITLFCFASIAAVGFGFMTSSSHHWRNQRRKPVLSPPHGSLSNWRPSQSSTGTASAERPFMEQAALILLPLHVRNKPFTA